jgi:hypothetical protein
MTNKREGFTRELEDGGLLARVSGLPTAAMFRHFACRSRITKN